MANPQEMTRSEATLALLKERRRGLQATMKSKEFTQRINDAGLSILAAGVGAVVPAYMIAANPDRRFLDEGQTIETEAVVAFAAGLAGVAAFVADVDYATPLMVGGIAVTSSYLGNVARERARANISAP